jgi:predicted kinase
MTRLIILIGLPGSGKSSLAQQLVAECHQRQLISTDAIRAQLFGDESVQGPWLRVRHQVQQEFRQAVEKILLGQVSEAIYDATNAARKQRQEAIALARACGFTHLTGLWVDTPIHLCLERNRQRPRQVPEEVILHMYRQLQDAPPALDEGLDHLIHYSATSTESAIAPSRNNPT